MKVFISWSGDQSRAIAEVLRTWLPSVLQAVDPYFSPEDNAKGSRWENEVAKELESSSVGLLCMTTENLTAPWLLYEAGALGKAMDKSRVCPLLFGVTPAELPGPLQRFQASLFSKGDFRQTSEMINGALGDHKLAGDVFGNVFEKWWPDLESGIEKAIETVEAPDNRQAIDQDETLRQILFSIQNSPLGGHSNSGELDRDVFDNVLSRHRNLLAECARTSIPTSVVDGLGALTDSIDQLADIHRTESRQTGSQRRRNSRQRMAQIRGRAEEQALLASLTTTGSIYGAVDSHRDEKDPPDPHA